MKLNKRINRIVDGEKYFKYSLNIPKKMIDGLGWNENTEISIRQEGKELRIKKKHSSSG